MIDAVRASLARHRPDVEVRSIAALGEGMDNVAYEVNGELVVRASKEGDPAARGEATRREAALLATVSAVSPLPIPEPVLVDTEAGILAYPTLPGRPLLDGPVAAPERLAPPLGEFLDRLHGIPLETARRLVDPDDYPLTAWRDEAEEHYREVAALLSPTARRAVERFLAQPIPAEPTAVALCHYDLGAEHILVDDETGDITGIIDWTDAALVDPMVDLALIYRDLGPDVADLTYAAYASTRGDGAPWSPADRARTAFYARCSLLADLAYGARGETSRYRAVGLAHLARTFA